MNYFDSITVAAQHVGYADMPDALLPLTIVNEAALLAGLESDRMGGAAWD